MYWNTFKTTTKNKGKLKKHTLSPKPPQKKKPKNTQQQQKQKWDSYQGK